MQVKDFSQLSYNDQLKLIGNSGKLKHSIIVNDYQFTVYKMNGFYVELKRSIKELFFEKIIAMEYESLPSHYMKTLHKHL